MSPEPIKINSNCFNILISKLFLICIFFLPIIPVAAQEGTLGEYFSETRPGANDKPTPVNIAIGVLDIDDIDGADQSFKANFFIRMQWKDPRLAKTTSALRKMDLNKIWNPRLQIANQQKLFKTFAPIAEILPDGTVLFRQRYWGTLSYPMNLKNFPLDHHSLQIELAAAGYSPDDIKFIIDEDATGIADVLTITNWDIVGWQVFPFVTELGKGMPEYTGLVFEFEAKRLIDFYLIKVILPLAMIVFMSFIIFFINPVHIGPKFSIAITAMLTLIAYRFLLGNLLPRISYLTRMDYFLFGSTFLVFLVIVETAVTAELMRSKKQRLAEKLDFWSRWIFAAAFIIILVASYFA